MFLGTLISFLIGLTLLYILGVLLVIPIKLLFKLLKNAVAGGILLIIFNLLGGLIGLNLVITPASAIFVGLLGIPGVILLLLFKNI